jgi:hypothetical protein
LNDEPVRPEILEAIQEIEVEDHADLADMLRLRLAIGVADSCSRWTLLDDDLFHRLARLRLLVTVAGRSEPLIEAYVMETSATFAARPGHSLLHVVAMGPTLLMNLGPNPRLWPDQADSDIASTIFAEHGFATEVDPTQPTHRDIDHTTTQRGSDIQFLRHLAARHAYECYVELDPRTGRATGHFHRPRLDQPRQGVLSVNLGEATNVNAFNTRYDMLRPATAQARNLDPSTADVERAEAQTSSLRGLGREPALGADRPRRTLLSRLALTRAGELNTLAQAAVDRSAWSITAEGDLNTVAYGGLLRAKRPVEVRGAGRQFSGTYYVERVLHTFTPDRYTQRFSLRRNAHTLTGRENFREDFALP